MSMAEPALKMIGGRSVPVGSVLHVTYNFPPLDPLLDVASFGMNYFTSATAPQLTDIQSLLSQLATKWNQVSGAATNPPSYYMSHAINPAAQKCWLDAFDISQHLDGSPHGSPIATQTFTSASTASASSGVPDGVALAVTLRAPYGSDPEFGPTPPPPGHPSRPRSRDRGRFFFGPLTPQAITLDSGTQRTKASPSFMQDILQWVHAIATVTSTAGAIWDLGVWSRVAAVVKAIIEAQIDDRPDYQRRRADQSGFITSIPIP